MAKFAPPNTKLTNPLSRKLLDEASGISQPDEQEEGQSSEANKVVQIRNKNEEMPEEEKRISRESRPDPFAVERLTQQMRYQATPSERADTTALLQRLSAAAGVSITHSNLMRASRDLIFRIEDRLAVELSRGNLQSRPMNEKRAIAFFEERFTDLIHNAARQSPLSYEKGTRS